MVEFIGELLVSLVWKGLLHSLWIYADRVEKRNRAKRLGVLVVDPLIAMRLR